MVEAIRILIVEDEEALRHLLQQEFEDGGFSPVTASSGEEAMAILDRRDASLKGLITDINLSGKITGWDLGRHAREIDDKLPIVYMTGASAHDWASKGVPNSILITKPFAAAQGVTAIAQLLNAAGSSL